MIARIVLIALSFAATIAAAAAPPADTEFEQRCAADSRQFCPDLKSGDPKLFKCLHRNEADVSRDCYYALKGKLVPGKNSSMQKPAGDAKKHVACKADREKLCAGKQGEDAKACLKEHRADLTADCRATMNGGGTS